MGVNVRNKYVWSDEIKNSIISNGVFDFNFIPKFLIVNQAKSTDS